MGDECNYDCRNHGCDCDVRSCHRGSEPCIPVDKGLVSKTEKDLNYNAFFLEKGRNAFFVAFKC